MSTIAIEASEGTSTLPEWRRVCHYYFPESLRSACGTATRKPGQGHYEDECAARRHSICVVCTEIWERGYPRRYVDPVSRRSYGLEIVERRAQDAPLAF